MGLSQTVPANSSPESRLSFTGPVGGIEDLSKKSTLKMKLQLEGNLSKIHKINCSEGGKQKQTNKQTRAIFSFTTKLVLS